MASAPFEIVSGPANIWIAATGTAFPVIDAAPGGSWTSLGYTDGGVEVQNEASAQEFMVDQIIQPVKIIRSEQRIIVTFTLTQITLERLAKVMDNQTVTDTAAGAGTAGHRSFPLLMSPDVPLWSMLVRGPSPYMAGNMQFELPRVMQRAPFRGRFSRQDRFLVSTEWLAVYDDTAATAGYYGILRAIDAAAQ